MAAIAWTAVGGETTLGAAITSTTTTVITLAASGAATLFANRFRSGEFTYVMVEDEAMEVVSINSSTSITVRRGALGTPAATHVDTTVVHLLSLLAIFKALKAATVLAVAA